jgi:DNA-binding beta-propeller fold protein YncE
MKRRMGGAFVLVILVALGTWQTVTGKAAGAQVQKPTAGAPIFEVDPFWPKMEGHFGIDGNWMFASIAGIAIDTTTDHVWMLDLGTLEDNEGYALTNPTMMDCCAPTTPVMEFDQEGHFIQGWGGPGPGYDWPETPHGITVDYGGNVWIAGSAQQVLKFTRKGQFLLQIGHPGKSGGSKGATNLTQAGKACVYPKTAEVFIADNRRVIVFDAETGKFKRLWGAYGHKPDDAPSTPRVFEGSPSQQFNGVQAVAISNDGLVYVADRLNNRIQAFKPNGTFVKEAFVAREIRHPSGTAVDLAFSADNRQKFLYVVGGDDHLRILERETLQTLGSVGRMGHYPGQFYHLNVVAVDSKGSVYTGDTRKRAQKFLFKGLSSISTQ